MRHTLLLLFCLICLYSSGLIAADKKYLIDDIVYCGDSDNCPFFSKLYDNDKDFKNTVDGLIKEEKGKVDNWVRTPLTIGMALVLNKDNPLSLFYICEKQNCTDDHYVLSYNKKIKKISGRHYKNRVDEPIEIGKMSDNEKAYLFAFNLHVANGLDAKAKNKDEDKEEKNTNDTNKEAIQSIIQRCETSMGQYGPSMVKGCVDNDIESLQQLGAFLKQANEKQKEIIANCAIKMKSYGWSMVKGCADNDLQAQQELDKLKN